jgi:GTPase SAR1 family protein
VLVFDVTNEQSFKNLEEWVHDANEFAPESCPKILIGSKTDLVDQRRVSQETAQKFATELGMAYSEVSSKEDDAQKIQEIFQNLAVQVMQFRQSRKKSVGSKAFVDPNAPQTKSGCC